MIWEFYPHENQAQHLLSPAFCLQKHGEDDVGVILADLFNESLEFTQHSFDCRVGKMPFDKIIEQ